MPSASTNSSLGVSAMEHHAQYYFQDGNIYFFVQNQIFKIHRFFFERESSYFRDRLDHASEGEDGSVNRPYQIHDVTSDEFADFLWVWYNPRYSYSKQDHGKWFTILKLATRWQFPEVRRLAIRHLEKAKLEPIDKIAIYKEYSVDNELLLPSYVSLCRSPRLPSSKEAQKLTLDTVLKIANAREQAILSASERGYKTPTTASLPDDEINTIVADLFGLTLSSNEHGVHLKEGQASSGSGPAGVAVVTVKQPTPDKKGKMNGDASHAFPQTSLNGTGAANKGKQKY